MSTSRYTSTNIPTETAGMVDRAREVLSPEWGKMSRSAFLAAAVDHYLDYLREEGYSVDDPGVTDAATNLSGVKVPWRPRADWAIVDETTSPATVQLAIGQGPGRDAALLVVAELLPAVTRGRYASAREMLRISGYTIDETRNPESMSDGRDMIPIRP